MDLREFFAVPDMEVFKKQLEARGVLQARDTGLSAFGMRIIEDKSLLADVIELRGADGKVVRAFNVGA